MSKIAVIGAGVIGLTTAVAIQERFDSSVSVTIFTENVSPNTTGDISAGLWTPYLMKETPQEDIIKWSKITFDYFKKLWSTGHAANTGISLLPYIQVTCNETLGTPSWCDVPFGFHKLPEAYLEKLRKQHKKQYSAGFSFVTFTCEPATFLPFTQQIFLKNGGSLVRRKIENFEELAGDFDILVNCAGLQAKYLTDDDLVTPIRGQITRVEAPWNFHCIMTDNNYIIPNAKCVILGGTKQEGDYNTEVNENDKAHILQGCYTLVPSLKEVATIKHVVGLRPGRSKVRLELEERVVDSKIVKIVHNYGHGGCGVTLCAGCAVDAAELVEAALKCHRSKL